MRRTERQSSRGSVLVSVTLLMFLFAAVAVAAAVVIRVEVIVSERFRQSTDAFYAAQAALDVAISELRSLPSWVSVATGDQTSRFSQGGVSGVKSVPGGGSVTVCCGGGSLLERLANSSQMAIVPSRRALAWRPFLWTTLDAIAPRDLPSRLYLVVFVAEDEEDVMAATHGETNGLLLLRAQAADPTGLHRSIEALITRSSLLRTEAAGAEDASTSGIEGGPTVVGIVSWREVRQ